MTIKKRRERLDILYYIIIVLALSMVVSAAPIPISSPKPAYSDAQDDSTCEIHGLFAFAQPENATTIPPGSLLPLVDESGGGATGVVDLVDEFLSRLKDGDAVYVYTFASIDGPSSSNRRLSTRRADLIRELIESRPAFTAKQLTVTTSASGETDQFWPLTSAEKSKVEAYPAGAPEKLETPALIVNRRVILSTQSNLFGSFQIRQPYTFYDQGCPKEVENQPPVILSPGDGEIFPVVHGQALTQEVKADDPDLALPGSMEELTFALSGNPAGMTITKTSKNTANIRFNSGALPEEEKSIPFTVTVTDKKGAKDTKSYGVEITVILPPEPQPPNKTNETVPPIGGVGACDDTGIIGTIRCACDPWYKCLLPLLLLLFLPWAFKRKRLKREALLRHKEQIKQFTDWEKMIVFIKEVKDRKGRIKKQIEEMNILIGKLTPELKARLKEKIRDVAYLYDPKSDEFKNIDTEGKIVKGILIKYLDIIKALTELHSDEMSLEHMFVMIEKKQIVLRDAIHEQKLMQLIQETKTVITHINTETEAIFKEIETQTREGGILLSGVMSLLGGTVKDWREEGVKNWWKKDFSEKWEHFHDPTYLRSEKVFVPHEEAGGLKGAFKGAGTRAWEPDYGHQAPKGMKWLLEKDLWPWKKDRIKSVKILIMLGERLVVQIEKDQEIYVQL
ncbi:MAG: Ig domain-containing protein, partial [Nanoarchaeota archaeon]|nr:Ig domain-containing protein [Nanoarchaeota archaeon]